MTLPNFMIIGAMKAGTTSLAAYLDSHPQVFMCNPKEPSFFSLQDPGIEEFDAYERLFEDAEDSLAVGEASTDYTKAPTIRGVPERIAVIAPGMRLIYVVRNPIDRIRSMYLHEVGKGRVRRSLEDVVFDDPRYIDWCRYGYQIDLYLRHFSIDQVHVLRTEDLALEQTRELGEVANFLGVTAEWNSHQLSVQYNQGSEIRSYPSGLEPIRSAWQATRIPRLLPKEARAVIRRRFQTSPVSREAVALSAATEQHIWALIESDLAHFSDTFGLGKPLWSRTNS